jgi:hypothetical protein
MENVGFVVHRVEDYMSGFPDIAFNLWLDGASPHPAVTGVIETKAPDIEKMPWVPRTIGYRPAQIVFRRKWSGIYFLAAWCKEAKAWALLRPPQELRKHSLLRPEALVYSAEEAASWLHTQVKGEL